MPLRRTQTTPNDKLPASAVHPRSAAKAHSGLCAFSAELVPCLPHRGLKFHFCETNPIVAAKTINGEGSFERQPAAAPRTSAGSRIYCGGGGQRGQKLARIDRLAAMAQLEMQLRLADVSGRADPRYDLPSRHFLPALHKQLIAVGVGRDPAVGMLNQNEIAVTAQLVSGIGDDAGIGRLDWRPPRRADIDAVVVRAVARGTIGG